MSSRFAANAEQAEYWNVNAGPKWVRHQTAMDARMAALTELLLARAAPGRGEGVLDVGCGTGATTEALAAAVGEAGSVLGVDISEPMLALARERCAARPQVRFANADAQVHPFAPGVLDRAFSRFGVMFFADPYAAFANLAGALRPGGRVDFVCWAAMRRNPWFQIPLEVASRHLGPPEPAPPRAPGPLAFSEPDYVRDILARADLRDVAVDAVETAMESTDTPAEQAEFFLTFGPAARLVTAREAPPATVDAILAELERRLEPFAAGGRIAIPATVYLVSARR